MNYLHATGSGPYPDTDPYDIGPSAAELDLIEDERPLIEAEMNLVLAEIKLLCGEPTELNWRRVRRAERRVRQETLAFLARHAVRPTTDRAAS